MRFEIDLSQDAVSLHISDESGAKGLVSHRSQGFQYFLSFFIDILSKSDNDIKNRLVLLDDPGIYLHPEAKSQLRESLKEMSNETQMILTTHSPSMIDTDELQSIRIVDRGSDDGTFIDSELSQHNSLDVDVLAPIRSALGLSFADTLFASQSNVLVEGYIDRLLINRLSEYLNRSRNDGLSKRISVIDVGGTKASYFAKILDAEDYEYTVLVDRDEGGNNQLASLSEANASGESRVIFISDIIPTGDETDSEVTIEDLFDRQTYCKYVNEVHSTIEFEDIEEVASDDGDGVVTDLESRFNELYGRDIIDTPEFDKFQVAEYIDNDLSGSDLSDTILSESDIEKFRDLISEVNSSMSTE